MTIYKYSEERRNDPELCAKVAKVVKARQIALLEAAEKLQEVMDILQPLDRFEGDSIYRRCVSAVWIAHHQVSGDAEFKKKIGGDTYIGNKAASELGHQIEEMGDSFDRFFPEEKL